MVGARESSVAEFAIERFVPRVLPLVPGQLVTAGKSPATVVPAADVRLLTRVGSQVRLQVGRLGVLLAAAWVLARVGRRLALQHDHHLWVVGSAWLEHLGKLLRGQFLVGLTRSGGGGRGGRGRCGGSGAARLWA